MSNLMRALIESIAYYKTHKEESFKVISKYLRMQDREVFEGIFAPTTTACARMPPTKCWNYRSRRSGKMTPAF